MAFLKALLAALLVASVRLRARTSELVGDVEAGQSFHVLQVGGTLPERGIVLAGAVAQRVRKYTVIRTATDRYYSCHHILATRVGNNTYVEFDRPPRHIAAGENISVAALPFPRQYGFPLFDPECDGPSCCSDGCFVYWIGDRMCDPKCNVKNCHFDNGDCN
jgi:hypothetical protein